MPLALSGLPQFAAVSESYFPDGKTMRILYDSKLSQFKTPFGTLQERETCTLHIMIPCSCRTTAVSVVLQAENGAELRRVPLAKQSADTLYDTWGGELTIFEAGLYFYYFHITTCDGAFRLFKQGQSDTNMEEGGLWQLSVLADKYPVPEAFAGAVMYQIFPDRFYQSGNCDLTDKLAPYWVHENKDDVPVYLPDANGEVCNNDFYGGNLRGIREKLPYLHSLGVEILYLNPIFYAWSTHRYDTCDYKRIDPMLGTDADFRALCDAAHSLGMKVILDGVFSHVGSRSEYFQTAIHDPDSPYRNWFQFRQYPSVYESWWGITTLPCINKLDPSYMEYLIDGEDSVAVHWLKLGADGWRLDVVDELPDEFLARLRTRIRTFKPDALLIGEVWEDASNKIAYDRRRRYFTDRQLDSVMNYPWQKAILRYVRGEDDGTGLGEQVRTIAENYPPDVLQSVMNILSTHDTPRAINALLDPRDADRAELAQRHFTPEQLAFGKQQLKLAAFLQFMLPGMPCIYYGDEAGMTGYRDPFNRCFYPWGKEDEDLISFYRSLADVKKTTPALRRGTVLVLEAGGGRVLLLRQYEGKSVAVCCNRSDTAWRLPRSGKILLGGGIAEYTGESITLGQGGYCAMERE